MTNIRLFSANGVKAVVGEVVPQIENAIGRRLSVCLGEAGELKQRILDGDAFDLALLPPAVLEELAAAGKIVRDTVTDIARTEVAMGVRTGTPPPDTSSPDAFAQTLLATPRIVITDPASGGVSGVHFAGVLRQLGIAERLDPRLILTRGVLNAERVSRGEADLAVQLAHEIHAVPGVEFVPLPREFQRRIVFSAGVASASGEVDITRRIIQLLSGAAAAAMIRKHGMEPAGG